MTDAIRAKFYEWRAKYNGHVCGIDCEAEVMKMLEAQADELSVQHAVEVDAETYRRETEAKLRKPA